MALGFDLPLLFEYLQKLSSPQLHQGFTGALPRTGATKGHCLGRKETQGFFMVEAVQQLLRRQRQKLFLLYSGRQVGETIPGIRVLVLRIIRELL